MKRGPHRETAGQSGKAAARERMGEKTCLLKWVLIFSCLLFAVPGPAGVWRSGMTQCCAPVGRGGEAGSAPRRAALTAQGGGPVLPSADRLLVPFPHTQTSLESAVLLLCAELCSLSPLKLLQSCISSVQPGICRGAHRAWSGLSLPSHILPSLPVSAPRLWESVGAPQTQPGCVCVPRLLCLQRGTGCRCETDVWDISVQSQPRAEPSPGAQCCGPAWPVVSGSRERLGFVLGLTYGD